MTPDPQPIRDAATLILVRNAQTDPSILMGQRGRGAVFMPDKFVFPGGAVDREDLGVELGAGLDTLCRSRLEAQNSACPADALAVAAIRELWEETGLRLGNPLDRSTGTEIWEGFGAHPMADNLRFFFRAVTPPGRPRRFDARFFLAPAEALLDHPDDHPAGSDELSHLAWVPLREARRLNLAFITELVLAELERHLPRMDAPDAVPFVRNDRMDNRVIWL